MEKPFLVIFVGHKDQQSSAELLSQANCDSIKVEFINISEQWKSVKLNHCISDIEVELALTDRYISGTNQAGLRLNQFDKVNQYSYLLKNHCIASNILSLLKSRNPSLVLLERNNYIGRYVGKELDKCGYLNGWLLPIRLIPNLIYLEQGYLNKPLVYEGGNTNNEISVSIETPDYVITHKTESLFEFFKKRKFYKVDGDYRNALTKNKWISRFISFLSRYSAYKAIRRQLLPELLNDGVVFYMHHQPEYALESCDRNWLDQVNQIRKLRLALPMSITLYLKESPSMWFKRGEREYFELINLPNTFFIENTPLECSKVLAVFSFSGTIALEAVLAGKNSFLFYSTWFSSLEGITVFDSIEDVRSVDFYRLPVIDKSIVYRNYLKMVDKIGFKGYTIGNGRKNENQNEANLVVKGLEQILNSYYGSKKFK